MKIHSFITSGLAAGALMAASVGHANSLTFGGGCDATAIASITGNGNWSVPLCLDVATLTVGGSITVQSAGGVSITGFSPSSFFNGFDTSPTDLTDFTGAGVTAGVLQLAIGSFAGITASNQTLGNLLITIGSAGALMMSEGQLGPFIDAQTTNPIPGFVLGRAGSGGEQPLPSIPVPMAAWLFGSALGLMGLRQRRVA
jgi:hypothetical protein